MSGSGRASTSGLGYEVEKIFCLFVIYCLFLPSSTTKMEDNKLLQDYDREEAAGTPTHIVNWFNAHIGSEHDPIPGTDWETICNHLRDGVALCKLINILLTKDGKTPIAFQEKKVMSPFDAMTNIENFNKGTEQFGLETEFQIQSGDLWEVRKGPFLNVINCLHNLGLYANAKNIMPAYTE